MNPLSVKGAIVSVFFASYLLNTSLGWGREKAAEKNQNLQKASIKIARLSDVMDSPLIANEKILDFDAEENGGVIVRTKEKILDVGGKRLLMNMPASKIETVALVDGYAVALVNSKLQIYEGGKWNELLEVPLKNVKLTSYAKTMYITGTPPGKKPTIFIYERGKGYQQLLNLPEPVDGFTLAGDGRLYYSIGPGIFSFRLGEKLMQVATLPGFEKINSMAADSKRQILYLSDGKALYALSLADSAFTLVKPDLGGELKFHKDSIYLLSRELGTISVITGLSESLTSANPPVEELKAE